MSTQQVSKKIQILPEQIANQIAAGEVVAGPSSVVKELVENSIDSGASRITVNLNKELRDIKVADNGSGMDKEDMSLAFKRHATSKIRSIEDLYELLSNGFRGEALASISSVSKVTCVSKREEDEHANKLTIENSNENFSITGAATGTSITVSDLFFNTPARLKFLRSSNRERNEVIDLMRSFVFAHPEISFNLDIDNKNIFEYRANKKAEQEQLKDAIKAIFGAKAAESLNEINLQKGDYQITGFCSSPHHTRSDKRGIFSIVNNRIVRCPIIRSACDAVYKHLLSPGKHPICIIKLSVPKQEVDVNVHPTKKELKYSNTNKIYTSVGDAISKALADATFEKDLQQQVSLNDFSSREIGDWRFEQKEESEQKSLLYSEEATRTISSPTQSEKQEKKQFTTAPQIEIEESFSLTEKTQEQERKFISRFGSLDISMINSSGLKSTYSSHGNRTNFEIAASDEDYDKSILLRGDFIGENWLKEQYLAFLQTTANKILQRELDKLKAGKAPTKQRSRPNEKPSLKKLEEIWQRDNYTCCYCGKILLHPHAIKAAQAEGNASSYKTHLNKDGKEVTVDLLTEHCATFDHLLPASKFATLNKDQRNLYTCCPACNRKKSDSLATKTWTS